MLFSTVSFAADPHHTHEPTIVNEYVTNEYITVEEHNHVTEEIINNNTFIKKGSASETGVALAIANAQHHFDLSTHRWQGAVGIGRFEDNQALSIGGAKRIYGDRVLVNFSLGIENGRKGLGAGLNWRW